MSLAGTPSPQRSPGVAPCLSVTHKRPRPWRGWIHGYLAGAASWLAVVLLCLLVEAPGPPSHELLDSDLWRELPRTSAVTGTWVWMALVTVRALVRSSFVLLTAGRRFFGAKRSVQLSSRQATPARGAHADTSTPTRIDR
jgi:hypothetical protein